MLVFLCLEFVVYLVWVQIVACLARQGRLHHGCGAACNGMQLTHLRLQVVLDTDLIDQAQLLFQPVRVIFLGVA